MTDDTTSNETSSRKADARSRARAKRPAPISWRPPTDKRAEFEDRLKASGLSANAFITDAVFGRTLARIPDYKINRVDDLLPWKITP